LLNRELKLGLDFDLFRHFLFLKFDLLLVKFTYLFVINYWVLNDCDWLRNFLNHWLFVLLNLNVTPNLMTIPDIVACLHAEIGCVLAITDRCLK